MTYLVRTWWRVLTRGLFFPANNWGERGCDAIIFNQELMLSSVTAWQMEIRISRATSQLFRGIPIFLWYTKTISKQLSLVWPGSATLVFYRYPPSALWHTRMRRQRSVLQPYRMERNRLFGPLRSFQANRRRREKQDRARRKNPTKLVKAAACCLLSPLTTTMGWILRGYSPMAHTNITLVHRNSVIIHISRICS